MQVSRLFVYGFFSHLHTCNPSYLSLCAHIIRLPVLCYSSACTRIIRPSVSTSLAYLYPSDFSLYTWMICPSIPILLVRLYPRRSISTLFADLYPYYSPTCIHIIRPPVYTLFACPYTCHYLPIRRHTDTARDIKKPPKKPTNKPTKRVSARLRGAPGPEGRRRRRRTGRRAEPGPGRAAGRPAGGGGSLPLAPSYLRPRGWRCRRWCAPPAGAWRTPGRSAPAPAPAPSPWPARAGGDGKMMKRRRRKVRRSTAYSRLPGAPGLTGPSCSSSAKGRQSLRARLGGR